MYAPNVGVIAYPALASVVPHMRHFHSRPSSSDICYRNAASSQ